MSKELRKEALEKAAQDLNESLELDPKIKFNSKSTFAYLKKEIEDVAQDLQDGDILLQSTIDTLMELEIDVPGKIKVKKGASKSVTKAKGKSGAKKGSFPAKNPALTAVKEMMAGLISQKKYTRKEIIDQCLKKHSDIASSSLSTLISDGKNPKYNKFPKLVVENSSTKILSFK